MLLKRQGRFWLGVLLTALLFGGRGVWALSGPECLAVSERGSLDEVRLMLTQHTAEQLFRVRDSAGKGLLHYGIRRGESFWRPLLEAGWPVNRETGWTPQHEACLTGNLDLLKALLERGAPVDVREPLNGGTPLQVAAFNGHIELVKLLVSKGANVNARDKDGWTPLSQARDQGYPQIVEWLKKNGATR